MPRARRSDERYRLCIAIDSRGCACEDILISANHNGKLAGLGARLPTRYGRVQETNVLVRRSGMDFPGNGRRSRGVIDNNTARINAREDAIPAEDNFPYVVIVANAGKYDVSACCRRCRRECTRAIVLGDPTLGL